MDALEISALGLVSGFHQSLKASLHQGAYTAAENSLLAEQIGFGFFTEGGLKHAGSRAADAKRIGKSKIMGLPGGILLNGDQAGNAFSGKIFASYGMAGSLGSDHGDIHIRRGLDLAKMDGKAVGEHQHVAGLQVGLDGLFVKGGLLLIVDEDHDDISLLRGFRGRIYGQALRFRFRPGFGAFVQAHDDVAAGFLQIQGMRMSLAAVTDHCDRLILK